MANSQNTEVQVFAGGLHTRPEPHLINQAESIRLANVNVRTLALRPYNTPDFIEHTDKPYMFYFNSIFHYFDAWRKNSIWNRVWYWSDNFNTGKVLEDGTELPLGIAAPLDRPSATVTAPTDGDGISGNVAYVYTYYDPVTGAESPPSTPSNTLDLTDQAVIVTGFVAPTIPAYRIKLYRIGGVITVYTAVITLDGTVANYLDQLTFSEIEATILDTIRAFPPPDGLHLLTEHQGRFYGRVNSILYFTPLGKPDSWYLLDSITFDDTISMIASTSNGLLVSTSTKVWVITGNTPVNFGKYLLSESEGCKSALSLAVLDGMAIWLSDNGFMTSNGAGIQNISLSKLGAIRGMDPKGSALYDRLYIMAFGGNLVPSNKVVPGPLGGADSDPTVGDLVPGAASGDEVDVPEGAMVIDFSFETPVFSTIESLGIGDLGYYNNRLYQIATPDSELANLVTDDNEAKFTTDNGLFNIVVAQTAQQSRYEMFAGDSLTRIKYTSPLYTEGSIGMPKRYEKVRITYFGAIEVVILDDSKRVMQKKELLSADRTSEWIGIPVDVNRAYGIQLQVTGVGIVDSLMYTWTPWETQ